MPLHPVVCPPPFSPYYSLSLFVYAFLGVTHAAVENWQYMEIIRKAADPKCSSHLENSITIVDAILLSGKFKKQLKSLFGLADLEHDDDFASILSVRPLTSFLNVYSTNRPT